MKKNIFYTICLILFGASLVHNPVLRGMNEKPELIIEDVIDDNEENVEIGKPVLTTRRLLNNLTPPIGQWGNVVQIRSYQQPDGVSCGYFTVFNADVINHMADLATLTQPSVMTMTGGQRYQIGINRLIAPLAGFFPENERDRLFMEEENLEDMADQVGVQNISTLAWNALAPDMIQLNSNSMFNMQTGEQFDQGLLGKMPFDQLINHIRNQPVYHFACNINYNTEVIYKAGSPILKNGKQVFDKNKKPMVYTKDTKKIFTTQHWILLTAVMNDHNIILIDSANWQYQPNFQSRGIIDRYVQFINRVIFQLDPNQPIVRNQLELAEHPAASKQKQKKADQKKPNDVKPTDDDLTDEESDDEILKINNNQTTNNKTGNHTPRQPQIGRDGDFPLLPLIGLTALFYCVFTYSDWIINKTTDLATKIMNKIRGRKSVVHNKQKITPPVIAPKK